MANENEESDLPDTVPANEEPECDIVSNNNEDYWGKLIQLSQNGHGANGVKVLTETSYRAGRSPKCELVISGSDVGEGDFSKISKIHFKIERSLVEDRQYVYLEDVSSNGTYINMEKVEKNRKIILHNASEISLATPALKLFLFIDNLPSHHDKWLHNSIANQFHILKSLGTGTFGDVKLVIHKKSYATYAMKKIQKNQMSERKIFNEIEILKRVHHPCIIELNEIFDTPDAVYITLQYIAGGNLLSRIIKLIKISEQETKVIFYQLLMGVDYLHKEGITHRDLKPENILVEIEPNANITLVKITDFGLSKIEEGTHLKTMCGTMKYMAPEVLCPSTSYDNKVDIWSLGVILYVCLFGQQPFSREDNTQKLASEIIKGKFKFPEALGKVSIDAIHVIQRLLVVDPKKRISIMDLFRHKWLQDEKMRDKIHSIINNKSVEDLEPVLKKQKIW